MICCRWKMRSWIYCTLSALPVIFGKAFQPVTPSNHKVRKFWAAITPYFLGQGITYRTVANQFSVPLPTVCRIVYKETKAIANNLTLYCVKFSESDFEHDAGTVSHSCKLLWKEFSRCSNTETITLRITLYLFNFFNRFRLSFACHSLPPSRMFPSGSTCATKRLPRNLPLSKNHSRDRTHRRPPFPSSIIQV